MASGNNKKHVDICWLLCADVVVAAAAAPLPGELLHILDDKLKEQNLVEGSPKFSGKFINTLKDFILQQVNFLPIDPCFTDAHVTCGSFRIPIACL